MASLDKSLTKETVKIYWQHSRRYPGRLFLVLFGITMASAFEVYKPFLYKDFFDVLASAHPDMDRLLLIAVYVFGISFGYWVFWRLTTFTISFFQSRVMADLLNSCFENLHNHSYRFFSNNFSGTLVRRVNKFSRSYEQVTDQFYWSIIPAILRIGGIIILLFFHFPTIAWILLVWTAVYIAFQYFFSKFKLPYDMERSSMDSKTSGFLADTITNHGNVQLFTGFKFEFGNFKKVTEKWFSVTKHSWRLGDVGEAIQSFLMISLEFLVLYVALEYFKRGLISIGDFALLQAYLVQMFNRLWDLGKNIRRIYEALADANEMTEIFTTPFEIQDAPEASALKVASGAILFNNVTFLYQTQPVFRNFSMSISPGERIALVGPSGGGKTTIVKLLLRLYDIQKGNIAIDGQTIDRVTQVSLRKNIALVPQEPILFHRTLLENIKYARPQASKEEVVRAAKLSHAHEFISRFPEGYDTFVGERGVKLSGGERQRVAIARAILKNAPIIVLDEATSSLDSESELFIQDALKNLMKGHTTIVIAHRLSTIMQMDRILVLENGKIVEEGKHAELLKAQQGTYQKLWNIQAGGFTN